MEIGDIVREIHIDAPPEVVFEVVSTPAHIRDWWSADTGIEATPGSDGALDWHDEQTGRHDHQRITVVDARPPHLFAFRWTHDDGVTPAGGTSLLVTFELVPVDGGTTLRMTETGFRERGWEAAVLEEQFRGHLDGWAFYLPRLRETAQRVAGRRTEAP